MSRTTTPASTSSLSAAIAGKANQVNAMFLRSTQLLENNLIFNYTSANMTLSLIGPRKYAVGGNGVAGVDTQVRHRLYRSYTLCL